ncbi:MAG: hypothetical protein ABIN67_25015 [Ferruginibacter sp.]
MKKQLPAIIGWLLLLIVFVVYIYGIQKAIFDPLTRPDKSKYIPEPLDNMVSTIATILLTNFGAVLGLAVAKPSSALARMTLIGNQVEVPDPITKREIIQYAAVIIYVVVLIACFICWATSTFVESGKEKPIVSLIMQHGKQLIGLIIAYLAFVLGVKQS